MYVRCRCVKFIHLFVSFFKKTYGPLFDFNFIDFLNVNIYIYIYISMNNYLSGRMIIFI